MAILSVGMGLIISAITTKYRDLNFAMGFLIQLWMYMTPIVYPLSEVPEKYKIFIVINPMTAVVESFRSIFLGTDFISVTSLLISIAITVLVFSLGIIVFNRNEKTFMDTI